MKRGGGEQMGRELSEMGKWSGVAGEVQFIGAQTGADTRRGGGGSSRPSTSAESMV
jgi:hypothetical protein